MSIVSCRSLRLATTVFSDSKKFVNAPGAAKKKSPATPVSDFVAATKIRNNILVHRNTRQINKGSKQTVGPVLQSGQLCSRTAVNLRQINVLPTYSEF